MTSPEPGGRARPMRVAGLALLGIAVGAALVGLVSLFGGGPDDDGPDGGDNAAPATTSSAPASPGATSQDPTTPNSQPTTAPAPVTTQPAPSPPPPVQPEPRAPLRVYNNSTITGLAAGAADDFTRNGWQVVEVANYSGGIIPTSTVYFQPGTGQEAAAQALANRFNLRVEPRFEGILGARPGLIVIVTNDYGSK